MGTREDLVRACHFLADKQSVVEDSHGNVSCRHGHSIYIKPSGLEFREVLVEEDVVIVRISDGWFNPKGRLPSVDLEDHLRVYRQFPWVGSICHTHSPYATAFAIAEEPIEVVCTEHADYFGAAVPVVEPQEEPGWGQFDLKEGPAAVLLGRHGAATFSPSDDPVKVAKLAVALEGIAKKTALARAVAAHPFRYNHPKPIWGSTVDRWHDRYTHRYGQGRLHRK